MDNKVSNPNITRRHMLARLGIVTIGAYVVPALTTLSQARASDPSSASDVSDPSDPSVPTPPTPPSLPSNIDELESDDIAHDRCQDTDDPKTGGAPVISQSDFKKAQAAVDAGYAKPLNEIWGRIVAEYPGRIIGIEFTGFRWRPRYRLRSIAPSGRLETVIVSARTGLLVRIVGC